MRRGGEGEGGDDEVGDGQEGPHRCKYEKVDLGGGVPVRGNYNTSVCCGRLLHVILYSPSASRPKIITASTAWTMRTGRRSVSAKAMVTSVAYTARCDSDVLKRVFIKGSLQRELKETQEVTASKN